MPLLLPPAPRLSPAEKKVYDHCRIGVEGAAADPEAYFGQDAPAFYATSKQAQVDDFLDRLDLTAAGLGDRRWQDAARRAAAKCRAAWNQ